ncbi:NepR family anti-sigma factor [Microvirga sesbaniae]|uniref:NepR family anti-sigma factor n=1 Tax=Microvirga sesbaniae TaxID=681392 RepID=UPI0029055FEB|nr:NepR family anti-sigma factor [Microvirga sp. HBU67692]
MSCPSHILTRATQIANNLNFSQEQVTFILRHSLRSQYDELLTADLPDRLKALVQELENKHTAASDAR